MLKCTACGKEYKSLCGIIPHFSRCKDITDVNKQKYDFYISYYKINFNIIKRNYIEVKLSLRDIERNYNIPLHIIKFILEYKNISLRTPSEVRKIKYLSDKKIYKEKYGVENPFQIEDVKKIVKKYHEENKEELNEKRKKTCKEKYGVENPFQIEDVKKIVKKYNEENKEELNEKKQKTCKEKYGVKHHSQTDEFKNKYIQTCNEKYNVDNVFQIPEIIELTRSPENLYKQRIGHEKNGSWVRKEELSDWENYKREVKSETRKNINKLYENFNMKCEYTNENLVSNDDFRKNNTNKSLQSNKLQPTIDHKISVFEGFRKNISATIIGGIDNLAIVSRVENSKKGNMEYKKWFKEK